MTLTIGTKGISREKKTIEAMIRIYCNSLHQQQGLCEECSMLLRYAKKRTENCSFGVDKPACKACPVHCYSPEMKEKVKEVMRFSGPRMIYKHPVMAACHMLNDISSRSCIR